MNKIILFFSLLVLISHSAIAQQPGGQVRGRVLTQDGQPASSITIMIKGTALGTKTDKDGSFEFKRVKPGYYTIVATAIGMQRQEKTVMVEAGEARSINFSLSERADQLTEVIVSGHKTTKKIDKTSASLRLDAPLLEIPQNIQIVSPAQLADQQIISMSDGLIRNVSGAVRLEHWGDLYTNISMRGSQIQALRNGFNVVSSYWGPLTEDMSFVDHIEFVKGPAGFMVSNGDPSGLYNVVTKKPTGQQKGEVSLTTGSFGLYRATLDLDGKLSSDSRLLYRLNIAGQNKKSFRDYESNNRYTIAPVVSYQLDEQTKLTAEYTYQRAEMTNVGSYYIFHTDGYAQLPRDFTQVAPGLPLTRINDHSLFLNLTHDINENWKLTGALAYLNYNQTGSSMWPTQVNDNNTMIRNVGIWDAKSDMALAQGFINGKLKTGAVNHHILGGIDIGNKNYFADWGQSHDLDTEDAPFNNADPNYGIPANGFPAFDRTLNLEARAVNAGGIIENKYSSIYLQDELGFLNNDLRVTLAGRYTYVKQFYYGSTSGKRFTPRFGVSYSVDNKTSVYGLYDQSFVPQTAGRLVNGGTVKPITGNNLEFGVKKDWNESKTWSTTLAAYQVLKNNEASAAAESTPANPVSFLLGQKKVRGFEFDLNGELAPGLQLTANYALTDSRVSKVGSDVPASQNIAVGDIIPGYAKHTANAWLSYKFLYGPLTGSGISGGFTYLADRETDTWSATDIRLPNYFKLDGGVFWERDKIKITANVFNILDEYLYTGSYYEWSQAFYWQAEAPRNFRLSVAYKF